MGKESCFFKEEEYMFSNLSIKWNILLLALLGPLLISTILTWQRVSDIRQGAEAALISKGASIVLMAEATRDRMAKKLQMGVIKPFTEIDPSLIVEAVPIVTAVEEQSATTTEIAESISQASIGIQKVTENVAQVSIIAGDVAQDIAEVNQASEAISQGSGNVRSKAGELSHLAEQLQELVGCFRV